MFAFLVLFWFWTERVGDADDTACYDPPVVVRRQIITKAAAAQSVAPKAMYSGVRSTGSSSSLGKALEGWMAASAIYETLDCGKRRARTETG